MVTALISKLLPFKWYLIAAVLAVSHGTLAYKMYNNGKDECTLANIKAAQEQIKEERRDAKKAIAKSAKDAVRLEQDQKQSKELEDELKEVHDPTNCVPNDDELRILRGIAESTKK